MSRQRVWVVLAVSLLGCGGNDDQRSNQAAAGASGSSAQAGATNQGGQAGSSGNSAAGNGGGAGKAGAAAVDCSGSFGTPTPAMPDESGVLLFSPTLGPDTLELIYGRVMGTVAEFRRSLRKSTADVFPAGSPIPELDQACQPAEWRTADLSPDGLRAYVACYSATSDPIGPASLHVAERTSMSAPFVLRAGVTQVGPGASISHDELTLFTSSMVNASLDPARQFTRQLTTEQFGAAEPIPGLEQIGIGAPDLSPDGLTLYGGVDNDIGGCSRPTASAPFSQPVVVIKHAASTQALGAPELSQDCRTLVYIQQDSLPATVTSVLMMARR